MQTAFKKTLVTMASLGISAAVFANPIVGQWKMSEDGQEKAIITISQSGDKFQGVMTKGLTEKAKKTEGRQILFDITDNGDGKYKGKGKHPTLGVKGTVNITVNGNNITLKSITGTQTGVRQ